MVRTWREAARVSSAAWPGGEYDRRAEAWLALRFVADCASGGWAQIDVELP